MKGRPVRGDITSRRFTSRMYATPMETNSLAFTTSTIRVPRLEPAFSRRLLDRSAECHAEPRSQSLEILVDGPQQAIWGEKDGCKQRHIDCSAAQIL